MKIFDFFFIGYYRFFLLIKNKDALFSAVCLLSLFQALWILLILFFISFFIRFDLFAWRYTFVVGTFSLIYFNYIYFKKRYKTELFKNKVRDTRIKIVLISLFFLILPLIIIGLSLSHGYSNYSK